MASTYSKARLEQKMAITYLGHGMLINGHHSKQAMQNKEMAVTYYKAVGRRYKTGLTYNMAK